MLPCGHARRLWRRRRWQHHTAFLRWRQRRRRTDAQPHAGAYPHATTNSECRGEPVFAARCVVDGSADNRGHGPWPYQSWGPDQRRDLWLKVDFGRSVEISRLVLSIRADFPHDAWWRSATLEFSDGSRQPIALTNDPVRQTFDFAPRRVTWARLCDLAQPEPLGWAAISEMEVWGADMVGR